LAPYSIRASSFPARWKRAATFYAFAPDQTCGSSALDKSVEDAAYRSSPMPKPSDPSVFDRDLIIHFSP